MTYHRHIAMDEMSVEQLQAVDSVLGRLGTDLLAMSPGTADTPYMVVSRMREVYRNYLRAVCDYKAGPSDGVCGVCDCVRPLDALEDRDEFGIGRACVDGCTDLLDQEREDENGRDVVNF